MLGDTAVSLLQCTEPVPATRQPSTSLSIIPSKDAESSPSRWRVPLLPGLLDTPSQVCLPLHDTLIPLSHFHHEWERLPGYRVQEGDWFVTIDLKDAYFHIQVVQRHRRFLRFAFGGKAYQYKVLPFGLALAPRTFTKCMDAALAL